MTLRVLGSARAIRLPFSALLLAGCPENDDGSAWTEDHHAAGGVPGGSKARTLLHARMFWGGANPLPPAQSSWADVSFLISQESTEAP